MQWPRTHYPFPPTGFTQRHLYTGRHCGTVNVCSVLYTVYVRALLLLPTVPDRTLLRNSQLICSWRNIITGEGGKEGKTPVHICTQGSNAAATPLPTAAGRGKPIHTALGSFFLKNILYQFY